jgi:CBS domain-containing protein
MKVRDAMAKTVSGASRADTVARLVELMKKEDAGFIPVLDDGRPIGVVTDRDIVLRCLGEGKAPSLNQTAEQLMTPDPTTIGPDASLDEAADLMSEHEVRRLPVVEKGKLVGILSHGNLVQATRGRGPAQKATAGVTRGA